MKILFLQKRLLFPVDTGWRIRTLNVVRYLARWHEVTYVSNVLASERSHVGEMEALGVSLETVPWHEAERYTARFYADLVANTVSRFPYTASKDYDPALRARVGELLRAEPFDLVVCDFVQMARNVIGLDMPASLLFQHNVEAQIFARHAEQNTRWARRRYMAHQWRKMHRFEGESGRAFDLVLAVSDQDRERFENDYGWAHVRTIDTSVDIDYFHPGTLAAAESAGERLVFVGSLDWLPNEDGLQFFVQDVWPIIRARRPQVELAIVGRNPSPAVARLERVAGIHVHRNVPDVRPFVDGAALAIVPLRIGGGTRLKVYEAMAMQKAIVSTSLGVEGLPVRDNEHLAIADTAAAFAECVIGLLTDHPRRHRLARAARELVMQRFSAETVARQFEAFCLEAVARGRARRATPARTGDAARLRDTV